MHITKRRKLTAVYKSPQVAQGMLPVRQYQLLASLHFTATMNSYSLILYCDFQIGSFALCNCKKI